MNEGFNVYCSDWLFGFGRFVIITTSQYDSNGKDIVLEVFVFAFDTAPDVKRFNWLVISYKAKPETHGIVNIDLTFMEQEAQRQARNLIYNYQYEEYRKKNDAELMDTSYKLLPCGGDVLIALKISGGYEAELKSIAENTKSVALKEYITLILSFPKLQIRDYKSK